MPQLAESVWVFTQVRPQRVWLDGHAQRPAVQVWPIGHALPQVPQLALLVLRSKHVMVAPIGVQSV